MKRLALVVLVVVSVGCAPAKLYKYGAVEASQSTVGVLSGPPHIVIISIDGQTELERPECTGPACNKGFEIYLDPGPHQLVVRLATGNARAGPLTMEFDVVAGQGYTFISETERTGVFEVLWRPKIVDVFGATVSTVLEADEP